jgi:hypothetical protein
MRFAEATKEGFWKEEGSAVHLRLEWGQKHIRWVWSQSQWWPRSTLSLHGGKRTKCRWEFMEWGSDYISG